MRTSILSRSVVAVATLAIGSVALAAAPANAASNGVTRDQVLTAVNGGRALQADQALTPAGERALRAIMYAGCDVSEADGESAKLVGNDSAVQVTPAGDDAQGIMLVVEVQRPITGQSTCVTSAFAATNASYQLSGTASLTAFKTAPGADESTRVALKSAPLSGDVFVGAPFSLDEGNPALEGVSLNTLAASAAGNATKTTTVTTSTKVTDKKSKAEKKTAKKQYTKRLAKAKKSYAKALDKAGSSKSKKAAAKKAYKAKRASAKAKFKYGIAGYKIVKKKGTVTDVQPFSVTTFQPPA